MAEPADINVDDLRRRARRRLVGAIVLALAAAVIVPMLLESEPKPLGDSVAVKIPPVDDGKFVNRLNDGAPKGDAPAKEARKDAAPDSPPRKSVADAEKAVVAPAGKPPKYDTQVGTDASAAPAEPAGAPAAAAPPPAAPPSASSSSAAPQPPANEPKAETSKASAKAEPTPKAEPPAKADPKAADAAAKAADAAATAAKNGVKDGFAVQLAAFSDDKGANSLANRLKRSGYPAYTEPLKTSRGTLWRVRVGPFPSREAANTVRDKLKIEGQNGIVAPTH